MDRVLLLVDDEPAVLSSLKRVLKKENYQIITAGGGEEALEILEKESVGVIVTDHLMPNMKGTELLHKVTQQFPKPTRMILTGYAELDLVSEAINKGSIYRFLMKPWDDNALKVHIQDAFLRYEQKQEEERLKAQLKNMNDELHHINLALGKGVKEKSAELIKVSQYDYITQLPNRLLLADRIKQVLLHAAREQRDVAVILMGLDGMTLVNDSHGHAVGDALLRAVAIRLLENVRACDTVARFTGDEFVVVLDQLNELSSITDSVIRLKNSLIQPYEIDGKDIYLSNSVGISLFSNDGKNGDDLIHAARTAMRIAQSKGVGNYCYYSPEMNQQAHEHLTLVSDLHNALQREEFVVFYQPQVDCETGDIISAEALVRWQHPDKGMIGPIHFIPTLEETGMIDAVGEWVLRRACEQVANWREQGLAIRHVSVNISLHQLQAEDFLSVINDAIKDHCIDGKIDILELEVTESLAMVELDKAVSTLRQLGELGIKVAIDDFGTGYASLSYLTQLPVDTLKIDKCFIDRIFINPNDAAIVVGIIAMAHSLGMTVVAEGVEAEEQATFLREQDCDVIQGYFYGKPVSAEAFTQQLRQQSERKLTG
jgi:diguanylate cyclase (GGDEF)-like protein